MIAGGERMTLERRLTTTRGKAMAELLSHFSPGQFIGLVAVAGGLLCGIVATVMGIWLEMRRTETAAVLKQDMLNRGMTADEIKTVLEAGTGARRDRPTRCSRAERAV
jgi:hypothetical protein